MAKVHAAADYVFYQSEFCQHPAERFLGERAGRSEILYNAVDTRHFTPDVAAAQNRPLTFLATGKFGASTAYRLSSSIAGLAVARTAGLDVRLRIAGLIEPAVESTARAQVDTLGVSNFVTFSGPYTGTQAPDVYRSAHAYLITKHKNDPCPNAVLEAMASGLPILYSASGGVPEQVGPEAGIGLPVPETFDGDVAPEADAIAGGWHNSDRRETRPNGSRRACACRRTVRSFPMVCAPRDGVPIAGGKDRMKVFETRAWQMRSPSRGAFYHSGSGFYS